MVDLCCGLGGDLLSLAGLANTTGVDSSAVACLIAHANCAANDVNAELVNARAEDYQADPRSWIHVDPDRRASGRRSTKLDFFSPDFSVLRRLVERQKNVAIKLAPATRLPLEWESCERQWLGDRQECKQQILWFGETARNRGEKTATAIDRRGTLLFEWAESMVGQCELADELGPCLYEPHPAIIAGRMIDSLANHVGLKRLASDIQYLTGAITWHSALTRYEILETCRIDKRAVSACLAGNDCGQLEIKKRGVDHELIQRFSSMDMKGNTPLVLVLTRLQKKFLAIICKRNVDPTK